MCKSYRCTSEEGESETYKLSRMFCPMTRREGSFMIPNMGMRFEYSGWEINSVMIRR